MRRRRLGWILVVTSLATIAALTLHPAAAEVTPDWRCIVCGTRGAADMVLNVLLFAPLGAGLALAGARHRDAFFLAVLVSGGVELAQVVIPGRDASIGDLLANSAGSGLGFGFVASAGYWLAPPKSHAGWLATGASLAAAAGVALTGVMLQPEFTDLTYYGQWTPDLRHLERYQGRVIEAAVGALPLPSGRLDNSAAIADSLRRGSVLQVRAVAGPPTERRSALFAIADAAENTIVQLGPRGPDLYYTYRVRAESFRLDRPTLTVGGALAAPAGDTITIAAWREGPGYCVTVDRRRACNLGFTAGSGWALLQHADSLPPWLRQGLDVVWLCLLLLPFGFWLRLHITSLAGGVIVVMALLLVPAVTGLLATPFVEWLGVAVGVVGGVTLRAAADRMRRYYGLLPIQ